MRWLAAGLALVCLASLGLYWTVTRPLPGLASERFVDIPRGASTRAIAELLAREGVVATPLHFLGARVLRPKAKLQAGEYRFAAPASAVEVLDRIARGDVNWIELPIPEGYNVFDIAEAVSRLGTIEKEEFLRVARDPGPIRDLDAQAPSLEGYLFPDTYHLTRHTTAEELGRMMTQRFRTVWAKLGGPGDAHRAVTMASLVEKETGWAADRPLVASVYQNRLRQGMKLDCDPTTAYAALLVGKWRGTIHRSDLERKHPYNTYQAAGLPPGPIANPGEASLRAALEPAASGYLYFVALPDGSGRHHFSEDFGSHQKAVAQYRRGVAHGGSKPEQKAPARGVSRRAKAGAHR